MPSFKDFLLLLQLKGSWNILRLCFILKVSNPVQVNLKIPKVFSKYFSSHSTYASQSFKKTCYLGLHIPAAISDGLIDFVKLLLNLCQIVEKQLVLLCPLHHHFSDGLKTNLKSLSNV